MIAAALAVPAIAATGGFGQLEVETRTRTVAPMPFETAGQSFPGSAFYYLEDTPRLVDVEGVASPVEMIGEPTAAAAVSLAEMPLAAPSLRVIGSDRDHMRAQECLAQAIYYEAASESDAGQRAVAQVVLNRVAHRAYPSTVCGVVYQGSERRTGCQFTFTCDGALARRPSVSGWQRASRHAREALAGIVYAPVGTATHYHTLAVHPYWASSLDTIGVIGAHIFYRWKGAAGKPSAFTQRYGGGEPSAARARAATPQAPDPTAPPPVLDGPMPYAPLAAPETAPAAPSPSQTGPSPSNDALPSGGGVREEYANSGRWLKRP